VSRPRAADDFATIRVRLDELRREREEHAAGPVARPGKASSGPAESEAERRRRDCLEGWPPPWAPTIFARKPRV
jgi:hypothetical protein